MLLASLATPGVDVLSIDGRLQETLWPAKQGNTTICVKAVSSHSGFFSNVNGAPLRPGSANSNFFAGSSTIPSDPDPAVATPPRKHGPREIQPQEASKGARRKDEPKEEKG